MKASRLREQAEHISQESKPRNKEMEGRRQLPKEKVLNVQVPLEKKASDRPV